MKVLFIQAKQKKDDHFLVHPPYGFLYLSSVLRQSGFEVKIYDMNIIRLGDYKNYFNPISFLIDSFKPDIIGIGGMTSSFKCVKALAEYLKSKYPKTPLIGGGLLISASPLIVMQNTKLDVGCIGEAEEIVVELFSKMYNREDLSSIEGLVLRDGNSDLKITAADKFASGRRKRVRSEIDWMPLPSYDLIDISKYLEQQTFVAKLLKRYFKRRRLPLGFLSTVSPYAMPLFAGRGCPFNCVFCFSTMDKKPIKHSVDYTIKHLEYLEASYGINHFQFLDENFNFYRDWVIEFCQKIIALKKNYYFTTGNRNRVGFFDKEMLDIMREANFYDISIGVESLDDGMLSVMNRNTTSQKIMQTLGLIKKAGIEQEHVRCLYGFPKDTRESIYTSINKGNSLGYKTLFALVMPLPGTELHRYCCKNGLIEDELTYMEEIYESDGYRNMTSFRSLDEVKHIILKANNFSEMDYFWKNKEYGQFIKAVFVGNVKSLGRRFEKILKFFNIEKSLKRFVKKVLRLS